jgi:hypothetical protein
MGLPFISSSPPKEPNQTIFNNPVFGNQPGAEKYQYHQQVETFDDDLLAFSARLEGKEVAYDEKGNKYLKAVLDKNGVPIKPFCNSTGRHELFSFLNTRLKPSMPLTNLDERRFYELMKHDHKELAVTVYLNGDEWEIDDDRWEEIHFTMLDMIENARRRAIDNEERNWVPKMLNIIQSSSSEKPKASGGLSDMFDRMSKKS